MSRRRSAYGDWVCKGSRQAFWVVSLLRVVEVDAVACSGTVVFAALGLDGGVPVAMVWLRGGVWPYLSGLSGVLLARWSMMYPRRVRECLVQLRGRRARLQMLNKLLGND